MADIKDPIAWCEEMLKESQLYHGTRKKVERLEPRNLHGDTQVADAGQVFEAGGIKYDVEKLWELSKRLPTKHLATDAPDFKDYMKSRSWTGGRTPEEILRDMDDEHKHMSRIKGSDLRFPVIMAPNHGIADGLHRMAKALHKGKDVIRYKQFESWEQMEPALIKTAEISFPEGEHASLKQRLDAGKEIYTTRISAEKGKYSKGQVLDSPFGKLKVVGVKQGKLKQHPFLSELTEAQKAEIGDHPFDLVKLEKVSSFGIRMSKEASMDKKSNVGGVQPVGTGAVGDEGDAGVGGGKITAAQKQEELEAWQRWIKDRNPQDFKFLLDRFTPLIMGKGKRFMQTARTGGTLPVSTIKADLIQNFHRALETYDPNKGAALGTHIWRPLDHTGRFIRTYVNIGKIPDPRARLIGRYQDREAVLSEQLGRLPSTAEMADDLGVSQKEIGLLRTELRKDILIDPMSSGISALTPQSPKAMGQLNFLHMELNPEQQTVLEHTYGMHGRQATDNNEDLAKILGISPQKVRAIKRQIARRYEKRYR